jgi:hypothetical protein
MNPYPQLSEAEYQSLVECEGFYRFSEQAEWKQLCEFLRELVEDAEHDLSDCLSSDPAVSHALRLTWQARKAMMQAVIGFVDARVEERQQLISSANNNEEDTQ